MSGIERKNLINKAWHAMDSKDHKGWKAQEIPVAGAVAPVNEVPKKKKTTGYNLFVSDKIKVGKMKMAEVGPIWKALSEEGKKEWNARADRINATN